MSDQGVREIQLNGKQLVFMFMTATVAAVVIFLCGVMVGRGVNTTRASTVAAVATESSVDPTIPAQALSSPLSDGSSSGEPVSSQDDLKDLTYAKRLEAPEPPPEPAVEPVAAPVPAIAVPPKPERPPVTTAARAVAASPRKANAPQPGGPRGDGFVVQVASLKSRGEADAIARRLSSKGFPSFVTSPGSNGPKVFRVRVGRYSDRREAETIARRLEREEQFKPWITR